MREQREVICDVDIFGEDRRLETVRNLRDMFLKDSDWTQFNDSPLTTEQKQAWATYRQALRDFPATWTPAETAEFPDPPNPEGS